LPTVLFIIFVMMNGTLLPACVVLMIVAEDLRRFTCIQHSDTAMGWTARKSMFFSSQSRDFSTKIGQALDPTPVRSMSIVRFLAETRRPELRLTT
jgi:hypothetical protein